MERIVRRLPVVVLAVALTACGETPTSTRSATAGLPDLEQSLSAHAWLLDPDDSTLDGAVTPVTLAFPGATAASGSAPCNTYRGTVTVDGDDALRIERIATTLMSCGAEVMAAEREYLGALAQVRTADVTDRDRLVLTSDDLRLSFTAVDVGELLVGNWALTGVRTVGAVESTVAGTEPIARFGADRTLVVETGCNVVRATWEVDGADLGIEQPAATSMDCAEPAGVMDQEAAIVAALTAASSVQVTPVALVVLDDAGDMVLTAERG